MKLRYIAWAIPLAEAHNRLECEAIWPNGSARNVWIKYKVAAPQAQNPQAVGPKPTEPDLTKRKTLFDVP